MTVGNLTHTWNEENKEISPLLPPGFFPLPYERSELNLLISQHNSNNVEPPPCGEVRSQNRPRLREQKSEVRSQELEVRKSEVRKSASQKLEIRNQKSEVRHPPAWAGSCRSPRGAAARLPWAVRRRPPRGASRASPMRSGGGRRAWKTRG